MKRSLLLAALFAAYAAAIVVPTLVRANADAFDALAPRSRQVEQAIVAGRFDDALSVALELQTGYPKEPLVDYWLATIYHGLNRPDDEARSWESLVSHSSDRDGACAAVADAYEQFGDPDYERAPEVCR